MPNCKTCNDTGSWETGSNDLPCPDCPKGSEAVFNVCTRDGTKQMTGAEVRVHNEEVQKELASMFLLYTATEEGHGGVYLWWKPGGSGYTRYIEEAGRFSLVDAIKWAHGSDRTTGAVPWDVVQENKSSVLKIGALHEKLEPGVHGLPRGWKRT